MHRICSGLIGQLAWAQQEKILLGHVGCQQRSLTRASCKHTASNLTQQQNQLLIYMPVAAPTVV
jgi:hypothetical protein